MYSTKLGDGFLRLPPWSASDSGTLNLKKERTEISELPKTKLVIYVFKSFHNFDLQLLALILSEC